MLIRIIVGISGFITMCVGIHIVLWAIFYYNI
jgi:hypothetical protein